MKLKTLMFALLLAINMHAQDFSGKVVDSVTGQGIPFVSIGILNGSNGTVSSENGTFSIPMDDKCNNDTIVFYELGYKTKTYKVADFKKQFDGNKAILLAQAPFTLGEVQITANLRHEILGKISDKQTVRILLNPDSAMLGQQVGVKIKVNKPKIFIDSVSVFILKSDIDSAIFRINIYKFNKNETVGESLLKKDIIVKTNIKTGRLYIDVSAYNIITDKDIIVSIESIKNFGKGKHLTFNGQLFSKCYYRKTSAAKWQVESVGAPDVALMVKYPNK